MVLQKIIQWLVVLFVEKIPHGKKGKDINGHLTLALEFPLASLLFSSILDPALTQNKCKQ